MPVHVELVVVKEVTPAAGVNGCGLDVNCPIMIEIKSIINLCRSGHQNDSKHRV